MVHSTCQPKDLLGGQLDLHFGVHDTSSSKFFTAQAVSAVEQLRLAELLAADAHHSFVVNFVLNQPTKTNAQCAGLMPGQVPCSCLFAPACARLGDDAVMCALGGRFCGRLIRSCTYAHHFFAG